MVLVVLGAPQAAPAMYVELVAILTPLIPPWHAV
jgi:hypothetical protein